MMMGHAKKQKQVSYSYYCVYYTTVYTTLHCYYIFIVIYRSYMKYKYILELVFCYI